MASPSSFQKNVSKVLPFICDLIILSKCKSTEKRISNIFFHYLILYFYHHIWLSRPNSALSASGRSIPEEVSDMLPKTADLSSSLARELETSL